MKNLMTVGEVSAKTRLARQTIYQLSSEGRIPRIKLGGRLLFDEEEIETWLEQVTCPHRETGKKAG